MVINIGEAKRLATDHACNEYRRSIEIRESIVPRDGLYGFDPEGWVLFVIVDGRGIGSDQYVAVNMETGETKSFAGTGE